MKHLKRFNEANNTTDTKPTILYLHGLDGELNNKYKDIINNLECNYIGLSIDYKNDDDILELIKGIKMDGIIGHSLGGYLAYHISNIKKIPALLLMPSFDDNDIKYIDIPNKYNDIKVFNKKVILIGKKDKSVDKDKQLKALNNLEICEENIDHDLTNSIFKKYSSIFIEKYLK